MAQMVTLLTAEDLERLPSDLHCELIDGVLIERSPPGNPHGRVVVKVIGALLHAEAMGLGRVFGEGGFILRRGPDTVRAPDVSFFSAGRELPSGIRPAFWGVAPDLLVEVISPWNTAAEIQSKVREWLEFGVREVWVIYPDTRTVQVIRSFQERVTLSEDDTLGGGEVLPGFSRSVFELFD
jgi:Uma2 family endonuclease